MDPRKEKNVELTKLVAASTDSPSNSNTDDAGGAKDEILRPLGEDPLENAALLSSSIAAGGNDDDPTYPSSEKQRQAILRYARRLLYVSHFFAQFSEISWQFCLTIFLAALTNYKSLILVATYGLTTGIAVTLLGSTTGSLVDRTNRLVAARGFIFTENICVILATLCCFLLLSQKHSEIGGKEETNEGVSSALADTSSIILIIGIHILGAAARVLDEGFLVAMERDWVVVMSQFEKDRSNRNATKTVSSNNNTTGEETHQNDILHSVESTSRAWLSQTNVAMKQIDLSCKMVAPAISGFLIAIVDNRSSSSDLASDEGGDGQDLHNGNTNGSQFRYAALAVGAINVASLLVEYYCTTTIYHCIPDLAHISNNKEEHDSHNDNSSDCITSDDKSEETKVSALCMLNEEISSKCGWMSLLPYGARVYLQQKTALAGIGLAMLYLNALTFDAIFTAYLVWRGMSMETIGIWRGISSAIGLLGTCVYHWSVQRMTLEFTGLWSIIYEFACLSLSYGSLFVDDDHTSLSLLIAGVCLSRVGLWVFDITVTQMMQESTPDGVRGVVGGYQQSLNAFFNLFSYALGVVIPDPSHFYIYVAAGYASVGFAMLLYSFGTYARNDTISALHLC